MIELILTIIMLIVVVGGSLWEREVLFSDLQSQIAWLVVMGVFVLAEAYLIIFRHHTLSNQMQYWIRNSRYGVLMVVFWGWLAYHFVLQPTINVINTYILGR